MEPAAIAAKLTATTTATESKPMGPATALDRASMPTPTPGSALAKPAEEAAAPSEEQMPARMGEETAAPAMAASPAASLDAETMTTQPSPETAKEAEAAAPSPRKAIAPAIAAVRARAATARKHSAPGVAVASAQAAAINPGTEQTRAAAALTVANLDATEAEQIKRDQFKAQLKKAIDDATPQPKTESEAENVMKTGATQASTVLRGQLATERDAAAGPLKDAAGTEIPASAQPAPPETDLQPEQVGAPPEPVSAAPIVPAPLPAQRLDYSSDRTPSDQAMAESGVTKEQLEKGNEPAFGQTLEARSTAEKHEATVEARYRQSESKVQNQAHNAAETELAANLAGMHEVRAEHIGQVVGQQVGTTAKNALERQRITDAINGIKDKTRSDVEGILTTMETEAGNIFEAGLQRAEKAYEDTFKEAKGGIGTWLTTWGEDWEALIEDSLVKARAEYMRQVDVAIDEVANLVDAKLQAAKQRVADGRKEVEDFVKGLDDSVKRFGQEALEAVSADFDAMDTEIDQRRDSLIDKLTEQYKASYERMSAMEEQLREENKSLWQRVYDATVGIIKKILAFKDMLLSVLGKAAAVIGDIISDPIGFLGNLVSGVMLGLQNFMSRIGTHLKKGLMDWLFGALAGAGLQLPDTFDLKGIVSIVLQVLGLTYANFRARAVKIVGEPIVAALEQAAEVFKVIITEGIPGLWRFIKEKVADLKSMVLDAIFDFIKEKVIIAGVTWIIGLLNPASAFFKACKAIYDIVMFFINRGSQILALVNAIIDSIAAIAKGSIGVAAKWVEDALAKAIPVAIGFLASLLGLGDISGTIRKTIEKAQAPVNKALDWVIHQAVKLVKAAGKFIGGLLGSKKGQKEEMPESGDLEKDGKVMRILASIDKAEAAHETEGKISRDDALAVAKQVKSEQTEVKSITVVDGGATWDYDIVVNPKWRRRGGFKGANAKVKKGIAQLRKLLASLEEKDVHHAFSHGIAAQLTRAEQLHNTGRLIGVEVGFERDRGAIDLELVDPLEVVEYKYWTRSHYKSKIKGLSNQLQKYVRTGKPVVLEMGITKTDPIDIEFVENTLLHSLEERNLTYEGLISIYEYENMISVVIVAKPVK
jgi:hypothetical protein